MEDGLLVTCSSCGRLHAPANPLDFAPVCAACAGDAPLRELEMTGSFPLSHAAIDDAVTQHSAGNFALGYQDGTSFLVYYVGRSDSDVRALLHGWVGVPSAGGGTPPAPSGRTLGRRVGAAPFAAIAVAASGVPTGYTRFAFSYAASPEAAFAKQWRNYDAFGGSRQLDNLACPRAGERGPSEPRLPADTGPTRSCRSLPGPRRRSPAG